MKGKLLIILLLSLIINNCGKGSKEPESVVLSITGTTTTTVSLAWTKNTDKDFAFYNLYRSSSSGVDTNSIKVAMISGQEDTAINDYGVSPHHNCFYKVYVFDTDSLSSGSNEVSTTIPGLSSLTIGIDPRRGTVVNGSSFMLDVWIEAVTDLFGASFELSYDNTKIMADSATMGEFLGTDVIFFDHYNPGVVSIAVTRKSGVGGVSGYGTLAKIYFHAIGIGSTNVDFTSDLVLNKEDGTPVDNFSSLSKWSATINVE